MKNKRINISPGALTAPLPPALVTVGDMECANVLTVAWTGILATVPPRTYISVRPSRHSYGILKEKGEFVINLPSADMARMVDFAGIYTGKKVDKFEKCGFTKAESEKVSAPTIAECPLAIECKVFEVIPMGSHDVFMADIVSVSCKEEIMSKDGRLMLDRAGLLAYAHGEYFSIGEKLGKFGFSTDKENKKKTAGEKKEPINKALGSQNGKPEGEKKEPFYKAFEGGRKKKQGGAKDKGRPHGKRIKAKGEKER